MDATTRTGPKLSPEAVSCLARWFAGPGNVLTSHEPHATLAKVRGAMDELVAAGLLTRTAFNAAGSLRFEPTPEAVEVGRAEQRRQMLEMLGGGTPAAGP